MNRKKEKNYTNTLPVGIIVFLLIIFFVLALIRTAYNLSKVVTEDQEWVALSDEARRQKAYGAIYRFGEEIKKRTNTDSELLFITTDVRAHYLVKYFLYPRKVEIIHPSTTASSSADYAAIYLPTCDQFDDVKSKIQADFTTPLYRHAHRCEALYQRP